MPFVQMVLINIPTVWLGVIMTLIAVAISLGSLAIGRRIFKVETLKHHHDITGPLFGTIGVIYAVLMAFLVVVAWQNYDEACNDVVKEANYYADMYRDTVAFSEPFKSTIRENLSKYVNAIVKEEWPLLASGQSSQNVKQLWDNIWDMYGSYQPKNDTEKIFFQETVGRLNDAGEMRRERLMNAKQGLHPVLWFILIMGGIITIVFTAFFGSEHLKTQIIMSVLFALLIALVLFTILALDYPFTGDVAVTPQAFIDTTVYIKGQ
jgi:hypothetical protein